MDRTKAHLIMLFFIVLLFRYVINCVVFFSSAVCLQVILIVLVSTDLAIGAGGPQRRRDRKIPTAARLAQLRQRALRARAQRNQATSREGRNLSTEEDFIINERAERNLDNVKIHGSSLFGSRYG